MIEITKDTELTKELLQELKAEHKKLFKTVLNDGTVIVWKRLSRPEYKKIMKDYGNIQDKEDRLWMREESCCKMAVVYPCPEVFDDILNNSAGVASVLSDLIFDKSGFELVSEDTEEI